MVGKNDKRSMGIVNGMQQLQKVYKCLGIFSSLQILIGATWQQLLQNDSYYRTIGR